jgi:vitamin B12 transporter
MNLFKISWFVSLLLHVLSGYAQMPVDSIKHLPAIEVSSSRLSNFSVGSKIQVIDSASLRQYTSTNLATILDNESSLFIKSYGLGSLATTSFRGGSATHTAILWNGFNLNSPMNGLLDLSLVPNSFINNISIQYGGASALWGSGAVGGTIHLNNDVQFNKGITVLAGGSLGSFENYGQNFQIEISKPRWVTSIKLLNTSAKNNFEYYNTQLPLSPKVNQSNAELKQNGLLVENYFRINESQKINVRFWYQYNNRNIPPTMLQAVNTSNQKDQTYRITSEWQKITGMFNYYARVAYFNENLNYSNDAYDYQALNSAQTIIAETEAKINANKNHFFNVGINNTYTQAKSAGYQGEPIQNRLALFASYRFNSTNNKFLTTLSARQQIIGNTLTPFTFSAGSEYIFLKWLSAKANGSKVYRVPTLNDLYWNPGGNINLLPESGYSEEIGLLLKLNSSKSKINFEFEPTVFNRNMDNWILWLPGQNYWTPQNIMKVWSRGMETRSELTIHIINMKIKLAVLTNYVVSTSEKSTTENDGSLNKQLIYVPMYSGTGKISFEYKNMILTCNQKYTGYRYTATDNSEFLKPYTLTNLYASYKITLNKYTVNLFVQANNLFNTQYQVLLNRAMPLRNYQAGLSIQFNKPNNN